MNKRTYCFLVLILFFFTVMISGCNFLNDLLGIKGSVVFNVGKATQSGSSSLGTVKLLSVPTGYYTPTELIGTVKKIEITRNGIEWTTVLDDTAGKEFDITGSEPIGSDISSDLGPILGPLASLGDAVQVSAGTYHGVRIYIGDEITGKILVDTTTVSGSLTGYEDNNPYVWKTPDNTLSEAFVIGDGVETSINFIFNVTDIVVISASGASLAQPVVTVSIE